MENINASISLIEEMEAFVWSLWRRFRIFFKKCRKARAIRCDRNDFERDRIRSLNEQRVKFRDYPSRTWTYGEYPPSARHWERWIT